MVRGFGQYPDDERHLTMKMDKQAAEQIKQWEYSNKDGTYTHLALECLRGKDVAQMRKSAMKVAVVVTDGLSKQPEMTQKEAERLKECVDLVFGVFISGVVRGSDNSVAQDRANTLK